MEIKNVIDGKKNSVGDLEGELEELLESGEGTQGRYAYLSLMHPGHAFPPEHVSVTLHCNGQLIDL